MGGKKNEGTMGTPLKFRFLSQIFQKSQMGATICVQAEKFEELGVQVGHYFFLSHGRLKKKTDGRTMGKTPMK